MPTPQGREFPLNLKDNSAYFDIGSLAEAGVSAIKIEGRMKDFHYVYTVTNAWRRQLESMYHRGKLLDDASDLYTVFNRDFSNAYLQGDIRRDMFSDHPRNNSATHLAGRSGRATDGLASRRSAEAYSVIAENKARVRKIIDKVSTDRLPLTISVSGALGVPLKIAVKTPHAAFVVASELCLSSQGGDCAEQHLSPELFRRSLKAIGDTEYFIEQLEMDGLQRDLFVPFSELRLLKRRILFQLNDSRHPAAPVEVPLLEPGRDANTPPMLSVLISSPADLCLSRETGVDIHLQLPNGLRDEASSLSRLLETNEEVTPWFPAILIGEDYDAAVELLQVAQPRRIVTNNSGIAYEAHRRGIQWIAGPYLNTTNSFALLCLKESFDCYGAFISNELGKRQLMRIRKPADMELYYMIYYPILLLTSRQCLLHQVSGCERDAMDSSCVGQCEKSASITNERGTSFLIDKRKGSYWGVYNEHNALNTVVATDLPGRFSRFFIDLSDVDTATELGLDKGNLIELFRRHLDGDVDAERELRRGVCPTTNTQYELGIK